MFSRGDVIAYDYLWHRQADAGEESGRKTRPTCVLVATAQSPQHFYLYPITTQRPVEREAIAIPDIERRRAGLDRPCWIILDEFNLAVAGALHDVAVPEPLGTFQSRLRSGDRHSCARAPQEGAGANGPSLLNQPLRSAFRGTHPTHFLNGLSIESRCV